MKSSRVYIVSVGPDFAPRIIGASDSKSIVRRAQAVFKQDLRRKVNKDPDCDGVYLEEEETEECAYEKEAKKFSPRHNRRSYHV